MLFSFGLLPGDMRMKPMCYEILALLPRFLKRRHKKTGSSARADIKRQLTWAAVSHVLDPLSVENVGDFGYKYVQGCALFTLPLVLCGCYSLRCEQTAGYSGDNQLTGFAGTLADFKSVRIGRSEKSFFCRCSTLPVRAVCCYILGLVNCHPRVACILSACALVCAQTRCECDCMALRLVMFLRRAVHHSRIDRLARSATPKRRG